MFHKQKLALVAFLWFILYDRGKKGYGKGNSVKIPQAYNIYTGFQKL